MFVFSTFISNDTKAPIQAIANWQQLFAK